MKEINQIKEALKNIVEVPVQTFEAVVEDVDEELASCIVLIGSLTVSDVRLRSVIDEGYGFYFIPKKGSKVLISRVRNSDDFFVSQFGEVDKFILKTDHINLDFVIPGGDESENDNFQLSFGSEEDKKDTSIFINGSSVNIQQEDSIVNISEGKINLTQNEEVSINLDIESINLKHENALIELCKDKIILNQGDNNIAIASSIVKQLNNIESDLNELKQAISTWVPAPQDGGAGLKSGLTSWASSTILETKDSDIENDKVKH